VVSAVCDSSSPTRLTARPDSELRTVAIQLFRLDMIFFTSRGVTTVGLVLWIGASDNVAVRTNRLQRRDNAADTRDYRVTSETSTNTQEFPDPDRRLHPLLSIRIHAGTWKNSLELTIALQTSFITENIACPCLKTTIIGCHEYSKFRSCWSVFWSLGDSGQASIGNTNHRSKRSLTLNTFGTAKKRLNWCRVGAPTTPLHISSVHEIPCT